MLLEETPLHAFLTLARGGAVICLDDVGDIGVKLVSVQANQALDPSGSPSGRSGGGDWPLCSRA